MNNPDFGLNIVASQEIYKDFISGKIINKYELIDGRLMPSEKFLALISDIDIYRSLYTLIGFELIAVGNEPTLPPGKIVQI
ncbi:Uncharacterised protein [Serratia rubidaea]|uniref:Uncharacterized protein n=1 Tax=Serratia rubidaea TaxID=61652 RepID=A0A447QKU7_SERRU|nr:Uncharacterised protein [Serratia rubidaea]